MIELELVQFRNFFQYGNTTQTFDLTKIDSLLIYGKNGIGKSTIYEAVFYNWYGKPYRKTVLSQLINDTNKKDLYTRTVCVKNKVKRYEIIRCQKPKTLILNELNPDDTVKKELKKDVSDKVFQAEVDKILGADQATFKQLCIVDALYYTPFLELTLGERRNINDRIFDLDKLSLMADELKTVRTKIETDIKDTEFEISKLEEQVRVVTELKQANDAQQLDQLKAKLEEYIKDYKANELQLEICKGEMLALDTAVFDADLKLNQGGINEISLVIQNLGNDTTSLTADKTDADKQIFGLERDIVSEKGKITDLTMNKAQQKSELGVLKGELDGVTAKLSKYKQSDVTVIDCEAEIKTEIDIIMNLRADVGQYKIKITEHEKLIYGLENDIVHQTSKKAGVADDKCDKCLQSIPHSHRATIIKEIDDAVTEINVTITKHNTDIGEINNDIKSAQDSVVTHENNIEVINNTIEEIKVVDGYNTKILEINGKITDATNTIDTMVKSIETSMAKVTEITTTIDAHKVNVIKLNEGLDKITADISIQNENIAKHNEVIADLNTKKTAETNRVTLHNNGIQTTINELTTKNTIIKTEGATTRSNIKQIEENPKDDANIVKYETDLADKQAKNEKDEQMLVSVNDSITVLGDKEVRSFILSKRLPVFNKLIHKYLSALDSSIRFSFDENFNQKLDKNFRSSRPFGALSGGLRNRVNNAILLSQLEFTERKSNTSFNFIFADELLDANGLDYEGKQALLKIFKYVLNKKVIVISHDDDVKQHFNKSCQAVMKGPFATLEWRDN